MKGMESALETLLAWKATVLGIWLVFLFVGERLLPAAPEPRPDGRLGRWSRVLSNGVLFGLNGLLSVAVVVPISAWASTHALDWRPVWWSGWTGLAADLLILDFAIYWWHRANHVFQPLWRFHEVHHLDRFLDTTTAVRFHFGEVFLSACLRAVVIILCGIPLASVLVFETMVLLMALFNHSNLRLPARLERPLSWVLVTPSIHWVHHHAVRRDTDSNYGNTLSVWDRLFGSLSPTVRWPEMPIGVERMGPKSLGNLLTRPFRLGRRRSEMPAAAD